MTDRYFELSFVQDIVNIGLQLINCAIFEAEIFSDFVSMRNDWDPLELHYKIVCKYTGVSQKSIKHKTIFFLFNTLYLEAELESTVKMRISLVEVLFA